MEIIDTLIVTRDRPFRDGFAELVGAGFAVVGTASLDLALGEIERGLRPRLLIMDAAAVQLAALQRIRTEVPTVKTVVLMGCDRPMRFAASAQCDIDGYIPKDVSPQKLKLSLGLVMAGQAVMSSGFTSATSRHREAAMRVDNLLPLTPREDEVLRSLRRGRSNKEIASELGISSETVKAHMKTLLHKLQARNRTEAAARAVR
jgi:DNA-binding NarL/FixJ family response regulator